MTSAEVERKPSLRRVHVLIAPGIALAAGIGQPRSVGAAMTERIVYAVDPVGYSTDAGPRVGVREFE